MFLFIWPSTTVDQSLARKLVLWCLFVLLHAPPLAQSYFRTTPRGEGVTDDIVFSGAGSGCAYDDEDDCTMAGSGDKDALVRPIVKIKTTPRPPTTTARPTRRTTTTLLGPRPIPSRVSSGEPPCGTDDEDCTGSGSGDYDRVDPVNTPKVVTDDILFTSEPTQKQPPDSGGGNPVWGDHRSSTHNHMVVTVNMTTIGPRRTSSVRTTKATNFPPKSEYTVTPVPKHSKGKGFNLSSNIILIVGITAGVLVILLLLAFAIYKYKSRDEGSYKVDESKNYMHPYQEGAAIAACNKPSTQVNGGSCARSQSGMQTASKPKKNVKEWYV